MAEWPPWILDLSQALPGGDAISPKQEADLRNAYSLFKTKTRGHPVENKLAGVSVGDAREAWKQINLYFVKNTPIGKSNAISRFWRGTIHRHQHYGVGCPGDQKRQRPRAGREYRDGRGQCHDLLEWPSLAHFRSDQDRARGHDASDPQRGHHF